ncbi:MAG: PAS domain S-box protein [Microscillaceae bacterium]|nr:PAS domain S-box protein [Microscillaceae bacterium]
MREDKNISLLRAVNQAQQAFIRGEYSRQELFDYLLSVMLELTGSKFGFIGKVLQNEVGEPYLKVFSITNIAWNEETQKLYEDTFAQGMEFHNLHSLFGYVLRTGEPIIANQPAQDPRRGGLPSGHPPLHCFLGIPVKKNTQMLGMLGIANQAHGYSQADIDFLEPFATTIAVIIEGLSNIENQQQAYKSLEDALQKEKYLNEELASREEELSASEEELRVSYEQIRHQEDRFRALVENAYDVISVVNEEGIFTYTSPNCQAILGYLPEELLGKSPWDFLVPEDQAIAHQIFAEILAVPNLRRMHDFRAIHKNNQLRWIEVSGINLAHIASVQGVVINWRDITEKISTQAKIKQHEAIITAILDSANQGIVLVDVNYQILYTNHLATQVIHTYTDQELFIGANYLEYIIPEWLTVFKTSFSECLAGNFVNYEIDVHYANDRVIWYNVSYYPVYNADNQLVGVCISYLDVTRQNETFEKIKHNEATLQTIFDSSNRGLCVLDPAMKIIYINHLGKSLIGNYLDAEAQVGDKVLDYILDEYKNVFIDSFNRCLQGETLNYERRIEIKNIAKWLEISFYPVYTSTGEVLGACYAVQDISPRKQAIEEIRQKNKTLADFRNALDASTIVAFVDLDSRIIEVNKAFCRVSGYSREELIGQPHSLVSSGFHPSEHFQSMYEVISKGKIWQGEFKNRAKNGHYYWLAMTIIPIMDDEGKPEQYLAISIDITPRKQAEDLLNDQNRRLLEFAHLTSHQLRQPLARIMGLVNLFNFENLFDPFNSTIIKHLLTSAQKLDEVIHQMNDKISNEDDWT